ncbi:MAG TPA: hypothetical protein VG797_08290, partial [Phycisphaerales bacterium]|nr:hypothetical protein [Phycisphaerales bacterium]
VLKDGDALSGSTVTDIFAVDMAGNGDWFVRGALANGHDFALRNGTIIAETGNPVAATRGDLLWGDTLVLVNGDSLGNYVVAGNTNSGDPNSDQVMVVNGTSVVAQEGDVIDLDGDGQDNDNAFVTSFTTASTVLADSGEIIFVASIRDGAGTNLGNAILRIAPPTPACPGDFDGDNAVGLSDIAYVIQRWGQPGYGLAEIATIIQNWASTCP